MPRRIRLFIRGGVYHVYNRVTRGEHVFHLPEEARCWINTVAREDRKFMRDWRRL